MIEQALALLASITTMIQMHYYGNKSLAGPVWGMVSNTCWWTFTWYTENLGLVPLNAYMAYVSARNYRLWKKPVSRDTIEPTPTMYNHYRRDE